ncbi:MAG: hypothetical protein LBU27_07830 [Candidatus Peribacteria bacterium]|jgi:hypothetical protein|nr:hypothetical protein [Candidatus Peribacteria bacterium]
MALYEYRYKGEDYYFPSSTFFQYNDYVVFTYAQSYSVSKKFYEQAKEYFLAQQGVLNELALAYEMYREQIVMVHQVKHVVQ